MPASGGIKMSKIPRVMEFWNDPRSKFGASVAYDTPTAGKYEYKVAFGNI